MATFTVNDEQQVMLQNDEDHSRIVVKGGITGKDFAVISTYRKGWLTFAYLADEQGVWWFNARNQRAVLMTDDVQSFRVITEDYAVDANYVYLENKIMPQSHPQQFRLLPGSPYFAYDGQHLYVKNSQHVYQFSDVEPADAETGLIIAHDSYCTDRDHLFHLYDSLSYANAFKPELEAWLLEQYPNVRGWWHPEYAFSLDGAEPIQTDWYRTANAVFYRTIHSSGIRRQEERDVFNLVRGAVVASFQPLSADFAIDDSAVYYHWRAIEGADPATFEVLGQLFGRDAEHVYYNGYRVEEADRDTFSIWSDVEHLGLAKDARYVYHRVFQRIRQPFGMPDHMLKPIAGAESSTFQLVSPTGSWATDGAHVYQWGKIATKMDADSFTFLFNDGPQSWAMDRHGLYNANGKRKVKGIDGSSFEMLNQYWGKDETQVFCFVTAAMYRSADASTFQITDEQGGAEDCLYVYTVIDGNVRKKKK